MGFSIVHGSPQTVWCPITDSETLYVGQLVKTNEHSPVAFKNEYEGASPLGAASGKSDTTTKGIPFGIVVGTNNATPVFNSTYNAEYITDATPKASTTRFTGVEGPWTKGGRVAMVEVAVITPSTVIRGPVRNGNTTGGVNLVEDTVAASKGHYKNCTLDHSGQGKTFAGSTAAGKGWGTIYFRTGTAAGQYRCSQDNASNDCTWGKALYAACSHDDKVIRVNGLRPIGPGRMQLDSESMFIEAYADASTNHYTVNVLRLDLSQKGNEYCEFMFGGDHFAGYRA